MARKAQPIKLSDDDLRSLKTLLRRGSTPARTQTRARVLDLLHRGQHPDAIAATLQVTTATVYNLKQRYVADDLATALQDKPRSCDDTSGALLPFLDAQGFPNSAVTLHRGPAHYLKRFR